MKARRIKFAATRLILFLSIVVQAQIGSAFAITHSFVAGGA